MNNSIGKGINVSAQKKTGRKKKAVALGSAGLMAMSLLVGSVTTANWSDGVSLDGADITAGNLDIEKIGDTQWLERSVDSTNFDNEIVLADYRIVPGDTIQARQDLDVALEGKNLRAKFRVTTQQLSGDLYSTENGVTASYMIIDEQGFTVVPSTPLGTNHMDVILEPDDVSSTAVDGNKDYTAIVTVNFDTDTPDQVRTQVSADLQDINFSLNQTRDNLDQPIPEGQAASYELTVRTGAQSAIVAPGGTARFSHAIYNTGNSPITDLEVRSPYGTQQVISHLAAGDYITFFTDAPNVTENTTATFEFYGKDADGNESKLSESTETITVQSFTASVVRTSSSTTNADTGVTSVQIVHEITNTGTAPVNNVVIKADGLPDSNIHTASLAPGDTVTLYTQVPNANWSGNKSFDFKTYGDSSGDTGLILSTETENISAGSTVTISDKVAMGKYHTCDIRNGGEVWCWGRDTEGQLGNGGSSTNITTPVRAGNITDAVAVESGYNNSFALTSSGDLYAWGDNDNGELGIGNTTHQQSPVLVPNVSGVKKVSAGTSDGHSSLLLNDGTVRVAGYTNYTGLHSGNSDTYGEPTSIANGVAFSGVKDIENGIYTTYLINGDGTVWGVGNRVLNGISDGYTSSTTSYSTTWKRIGSHNNAEKLWGRNHGGVYRTTDGTYYGWGHDYYGQLGLGNNVGARSLTALPHYTDAAQLTFGASHAIMLKNDGTVWANGHNSYGQVGDGSTSDRYSPTQISGISGDVTGVHAGYYNSSVTTTTGRYAWGYNGYGQLGVSSTASKILTPQVVVQ